MITYNYTISREFWQDLNRLPNEVAIRTQHILSRMLQNPWSTELHPEKINNAEPGVHSCRADDSYRIIWKHIKPKDIVFCLVDKHDDAYRRAARKSFTLDDGVVKVADVLEVGAKAAGAKGPLFEYARQKDQQFGTLFVGYRDQELLDFGVPLDLLPNVRALDDANQLTNLERLLPANVFNKLVEIALDIVERPSVPDEQLQQSLETYQGGDELCRFVNSEEFQRALKGDMEEWMLFLAPSQRYLSLRDYNGPARVKGVSGSGKTVVALHRARYLAKKALERQGKILFLTYGNRLPGVISHLLEKLAGENAPELQAVECCTIHHWCFRLLSKNGIYPNVNEDALGEVLSQAIADSKFLFA